MFSQEKQEMNALSKWWWIPVRSTKSLPQSNKLRYTLTFRHISHCSNVLFVSNTDWKKTRSHFTATFLFDVIYYLSRSNMENLEQNGEPSYTNYMYIYYISVAVKSSSTIVARKWNQIHGNSYPVPWIVWVNHFPKSSVRISQSSDTYAESRRQWRKQLKPNEGFLNAFFFLKWYKYIGQYLMYLCSLTCVYSI